MANIKKSFNFRSGVQVDDDNLVVDTNGAVGIGTTIPTELLEVFGGNIKASGNITGEQANFTSITATNLNIENVSTTGSVSGSGINIGNPVGIITAESVSGLVTYYGDGQYLQNIPTSQWVDKDAGLGFISIYSAGNVGVSTDDPRYDFQVGGNNNVNAFEKGVGINSEGGIIATGVVTATTFKGSFEGDTTSTTSTITNLTTTDIDNSGTINTGGLVSGIVTSTTIDGASFITYPHGSTTTFTITVADKTSNHRYFGQGNSKGYFVNGKESPTLSLISGRTYRFDVSDSSNTSYPLRFYYDLEGTKIFGSNVIVSGTEGTAGAFVEITITDSTSQKLYYQAASGAEFVGNVIDTNSSSQVNNLDVVGFLTATNIQTNHINGNITSGISTITQVDSIHLGVSGIGTINTISSTQADLGITTVTKGHVFDNLGVGTDRKNPQKIVEIASVGISTVEIVGKESVEISLGQNFNSNVSIAESTSYIKFGSVAKSLEFINGDVGDVNSYIHSAAFTGINTGGFNWLYGQTNSKLMTLSYKGHLGINNPDPQVQLDVIGVSTFNGSVKVIGNLQIEGGSLLGGNIDFPDLITGSDIFRQTGISTFLDIDVTNSIETTGIFIGTSRENSAGVVDAQGGRGLFAAVSIGTSITSTTLTVDGGISGTGAIGIGTSIPTCAVDFGTAGVPISRFLKLPRVTTTERGNLVALQAGSVIWNSTVAQIQYYDGSSWNSLT